MSLDIQIDQEDIDPPRTPGFIEVVN